MLVENVSEKTMLFESFPPPQKTSIFEHVSALRMKRPVASLAGPVWSPRQFDEAVVEAEVVPQTVLPSLRVFSVVREAVHDELVDFAQSHDLVSGALYGHGCESDVGIRRLLIAVGISSRSWHFPCSDFAFSFQIVCSMRMMYDDRFYRRRI